MSYNAKDVLHASLVIDIPQPGGPVVIESSGIDRASIVFIAPGVIEFELEEGLAPNLEQNVASDAHLLVDPGPPALALPLPHSLIAPGDDQRLRRLQVTDFQGAPLDDAVRARLMFYQFNPTS